MSRLRTLPNRVAIVGSRLAVMQPGSWRADKGTSTQRGYGYKWQKARAAYLAKHPLCVTCETEGMVTAATVVDHIVPHRGDMAIFWDSSNWQGLCVTHHSSDKQRAESRDAGMGSQG